MNWNDNISFKIEKIKGKRVGRTAGYCQNVSENGIYNMALHFSMEKAQEGIITFATYKNCTRICMTSSSSRLVFHTHLAPQYQKSMYTYQLRPRKVSDSLKIL